MGLGVGALVFYFVLYTVWMEPDYLETHRIDKAHFSQDEEQPANEADAILDNTIYELLDGKHGAPRRSDADYQARLQTVCRVYDVLCDIVSLEGDFSMEERYFYTNIPIFVIARMDRYLDSNASIASTLSHFTISDASGRR